MNNIENWIRKYPLFAAIAVVSAGSGVGLVVAALISNTELSTGLINLSANLIFLGLIGGLLKILLDDFTKSRQDRAEFATFITNILDDLKNVYDRVERVRIVIPAHCSAKTYGDEMRDLIDARVTLKNVIRAAVTRPGFQDEIEKLDCSRNSNNRSDCKAPLKTKEGTKINNKAPLIHYVGEMEQYLKGLTDRAVYVVSSRK